MELSPEYINDLMINFGGFIISAVLGAIFYALIVRRKKVKPQTVIGNNTGTPPIENSEERFQSRQTIDKNIEFIKLGANNSRLPEQVQKSLSTSGELISSRRNNRLEIINLAQKMMKTGATFESIKKVLPISDAELNLLTMKNNSN